MMRPTNLSMSPIIIQDQAPNLNQTMMMRSMTQFTLFLSPKPATTNHKIIRLEIFKTVLFWRLKAL